ncbi:uncharacterized protein LOC132265001 [Phlebotomus argentipes]|uniref:uncharacterized protein LOC132265001 n=1 Tax=Phlebotomus argentipes TaxID=94469 RepID=UPI002892C883|nr:uncharacterized protein LOC132265001 [Phlebotomus argentipes]
MARGRKKNKIEEVEKPRGFDRALEFEKIVGSTLANGEFFFLVKWQNCTELDLMTSQELNERIPQDMIKYYETHGELMKRFKNRVKLEGRAKAAMTLPTDGKKPSDSDFTVEVKVDNSGEDGKFSMKINKQEAKTDIPMEQ